VASIAGGTFLLVTTEFLPIGLLTAMAKGLDVPSGQAGLTVTIPGVVAAVAAPALTIAARRLNRRIVLLALTALIIASNIVVAAAPNFSFLLSGRVLLGVGVGGLWSFAIAAGRRLVPEASGARATSIISAGIGIGTVVGVPAGAMIGDWAGWRMAFAGTAVFGVAVLIAQLALLPTLPARQAISARRLFAMVHVPRARLGLVVATFVAGGHFVAYTFLELFLRQVPQFDQGMLGVALITYAVAGIIGAFAGEIAAKRGTRGAFVGVALLLGISVLLAAAFGDNGVLALILITLWGLAFGAVPVCNQIWMYEAAPELYEGGSALVVTVFQFALALGALLGGVLVDEAGVATAFAVSGFLSIAGAVAAGLFDRAPKAAAGSRSMLEEHIS
jgi:predicted MFS family arabinose efflux permease